MKRVLNNVVIYEDFTEMKIDAAKQVSEGTHRLSGFNRKSYEDHSYQDESMIARKSDRDDHYFVTESGKVITIGCPMKIRSNMMGRKISSEFSMR